MNIKSVTGMTEILPTKIKKESKTESSTDRDANGRSSDGNAEKKKFTEEEIQKILEYMKALDGIKNNNLSVTCERHNDQYIVSVLDYQGKIVRRIPEKDLYQFYIQAKEKTSGHILNKAM
jgi:uncharacterized FlaG/YvyC family protein